MKKITSLLLFTFLTTFLMAQKAPKQKEIGITFGDLSKNNYGIVYYEGTQKSMWRFSFMSVTGNLNRQKNTSYNTQNNISTSNNTNTGFSFGIGKVYNTNLNKHIEFWCGPSLSLNFGYNMSKGSTVLSNSSYSSKTYNYGAGILAAMEFNYKINEHFLIGLGFYPGVSYNLQTQNSYQDGEKQTTMKSHSLSWSITNSGSGHFSLIYRF